MSTQTHTEVDAESSAADAVSPLGSRYTESETFRCGDVDPYIDLVRRVAAFAEIDPFDAEETLYDAIDVDIVERMVAGCDEGDLRLAFRLFGCDVELRNDGRATVYRPLTATA